MSPLTDITSFKINKVLKERNKLLQSNVVLLTKRIYLGIQSKSILGHIISTELPSLHTRVEKHSLIISSIFR